MTEVRDGTVEIRSISREAGARTKMAVSSNDPNVDPVGACVGINGARVLHDIQLDALGRPEMLARNLLVFREHRVHFAEINADILPHVALNGARVNAIVDELRGEKIDIINWSDDPATLFAEINADILPHVALNDTRDNIPLLLEILIVEHLALLLAYLLHNDLLCLLHRKFSCHGLQKSIRQGGQCEGYNQPGYRCVQRIRGGFPPGRARPALPVSHALLDD